MTYSIQFNDYVNILLDDLLTLLERSIELDKEIFCPFFDDIENKFEFVRRNREFSELFDFPEHSDIYDSPFKINKHRSKEDVLDFIKILKAFIEINDSKDSVIKTIFKWNDSNVVLLNKIFTFGKNKDIYTFFGYAQFIIR